MNAEFISAVLDGTLKVADVDPSLQWGALGGGVGAAGSLLKSIANRDSLGTTVGQAALMGLLGAGLGTGVSAGTRLLGYKPTTPGVALASPKKDKPSMLASAGVGLAGAAGLGGLAEMRQLHHQNKALGDFFFGGNAKKLDLKGLPAAKTNRLLRELHQGMSEKGLQDAPGFMDKLLGKTNFGEAGMGKLQSRIQVLGKSGGRVNAQHAQGLKMLLSKLNSPELIEKFPGIRRRYVDTILSKLHGNPKGILAAAAVLGLGHLGASSLAHHLKD